MEVDEVTTTREASVWWAIEHARAGYDVEFVHTGPFTKEQVGVISGPVALFPRQADAEAAIKQVRAYRYGDDNRLLYDGPLNPARVVVTHESCWTPRTDNTDHHFRAAEPEGAK